MGQRGRYKYICEECNAANWLTARERSSRFASHCVECGSAYLEPSPSSKGPEKIAERRASVQEQIEIQDKKMGKEK